MYYLIADDKQQIVTKELKELSLLGVTSRAIILRTFLFSIMLTNNYFFRNE